MKKNGLTFKLQAFDVNEGAIPRDLVKILDMGGREVGEFVCSVLRKPDGTRRSCVDAMPFVIPGPRCTNSTIAFHP